MLNALWNIWLELAPWLLLGAIAGGVLHALLPPGWLRRHLSGRFSVMKAVLFGIPLPLCSCGVIPVGLGLRKDGAGRGASVGFLISTPQTGVDSILISGTFLGWPFALLKVLVALVTGVVGGSLTDWMTPEDSTDTTAAADAMATKRPGRWRMLFEHTIELVRSIYGWLVVGVIVSAMISWLVPPQSLSEYGLLSGLSALLVTLVISLPLYVCATASVPIAAALVAGGLPTGAALVFLMAGPATNVATLGAVYRTLGRTSLAIYLSTIVLGSLAAGLFFNQVLSPVVELPDHHVHGASWWRITCGVVLLAMILRFILQDVQRQFRRRKADEIVDGEIRLSISGMTCDGCAAKLERALQQTSTVDHAQVSFADGTASVRGTATEAEVARVIEDAGFATVGTANDEKSCCGHEV